MNEDQIKGRAKDVKGKIKEATGKVVDSDRLKGEGVADQVAGKSQAAYGDAKQKAKDAAKDVLKKVDD